MDKRTETVILRIEGMTCAACSGRVEKVTSKLKGVVSSSVNLASEKATIVYDPTLIKLPQIKVAVSKAGYKAVDISGDDKCSADKIEDKFRSLRVKLIIASAFCMPLLYISMGHMIGLPLPSILHMEHHPLAFAIVQAALTLPIVAVGWRFYYVGFRAIFMRSPNMDSLIAMGTSAALIYSFYSLYSIAHGASAMEAHLYFESAAVIITLILLGKTLEARSKGKTSDAIKKLMSLTPKTAVIVRGGREVSIPAAEVAAGDLVLIRPGDKFPVDGVIVEGTTSVDEQMLTGESIPADKKIGDNVFAACINQNGSIVYRATKVGVETALAQIIKLVEQAQGSKAPIARLADTVSGYFVPFVFLIALIAFAGWMIYTGDIAFSLSVFISVMVIACPCALGLATPTAIMVATGRAAQLGILVKSGAALETAHTIDCVVLDKTGTVTQGKPDVCDVIAAEWCTKDELLKIAASAEKGSEHPLARAIAAYAENAGTKLYSSSDFAALPGHGILAKVDGMSVLIGNGRVMDDNAIAVGQLEIERERLSVDGKTAVYVAVDNKVVGIIALADVIRPDSAEAVRQLIKTGIEVIMLTGDNSATAAAIAKQAGITSVIAEVLPQDKANEIKKLQSQGRKVAMVGDGINDAPALAQADVGIAIGSGTDIAIDSADIVLIGGGLSSVPTALRLSDAAMRNIKQNLFWAFGYNVVGIPIAAGILHIFGGPLLNPMIGAAAMSLSSVSVLTNALRLRRFR